MSPYARPSWRLFRQLFADAGMLAWVWLWWGLGRGADAALRQLTGPALDTARTASDLRAQMADAARQAGEVPLVGDRLRGPFDQMSTSLDGLTHTAAAQAATLDQVATLAGWMVFLAPVAVGVALWLPVRWRYARAAGQARALAASGVGDELLALRALAHRPLAELRRAADEPVAAWQAGDAVVVRALADLELNALGVRRPGGASVVTRASRT